MHAHAWIAAPIAHFPSQSRACPVVTSAWDRYRGLLLLLAGIAAFVAVVWIGLTALIRSVGGTMGGGARRMLALAVWALTTAQTVSQVRFAVV
jgi:hypothetical protein